MGVGVSIIHDLGSMVCIYLSRGKGGEVVVSAFHDQRSAIWIYFIGGKGVWEGISVIHHLILYLPQWRNGGMVKGICYSRSAICDLHLLKWNRGICYLRSVICDLHLL